MRIAIIGGGVSGLSTYLFLLKSLPNPPTPSPPHEFIIYETYDSLTRKQREAASRSPVGGGLGVAPNGIRVFRLLDPEIHAAIVAQGYSCPRFQFKNSRGSTLGSMPTVDLRGAEPEYMLMTTRQSIVDCLREKIPDMVIVKDSVVAIDRTSAGKPLVKLHEGNVEEFDLVFGADGVRSVVRETVVGTQYPAKYTGAYTIGGFMPSDILPPPPEGRPLTAPHSHVVMTFGAEGFFGYGPCDGPQHHTSLQGSEAPGGSLPYGNRAMWWSRYPRDSSETRNVDVEDMQKQLLKRHANWKDPVIRRILTETKMDTAVATWITPKLPTWAADRVFLVGDAAHALPSSSGQGVSTSLEDAYTLSLLFKHYLSQAYAPKSSDVKAMTEEEAIRVICEKYTSIRKPRVEQILDAAMRISNQTTKLGIFQEWIMYSFMWVLCNFFPNVLNKPIMNYSVEDEVAKATKAGEKALG